MKKILENMIIKWHRAEYTLDEIARGRVDTGIHRTTGLKNTDKHTRIHD